MKKKGYRLGLNVLVAVTMAFIFGAANATAAGIKKQMAIAPSAFTPEDSETSYSYGPVGEFLKLDYTGDVEETAWFSAPIVFQKGSIFLKKVWVYLNFVDLELDDGILPEATIELWRLVLADGGSQMIESEVVEDIGYREIPIEINGNEKITGEHAYYIRVEVNLGVQIFGAKVKFKK